MKLIDLVDVKNLPGGLYGFKRNLDHSLLIAGLAPRDSEAKGEHRQYPSIYLKGAVHQF